MSKIYKQEGKYKSVPVRADRQSREGQSVGSFESSERSLYKSYPNGNRAGRRFNLRITPRGLITIIIRLSTNTSLELTRCESQPAEKEFPASLITI